MSDPVSAPPATGRLVRRFIETHPVDAARVMERFSGRVASSVVGDLPTSKIAPVLEAMPDHVGAECVAGLDPGRGAAVLAELDLDQESALLRRMDEDQRRRLLDAMPPDRASQLLRVLAFPPGSAGALMDPKVLSVPDSLTAGEALERVRSAPHLTLYYLYLYDGASRLSGVVNLRELMLSDPEVALTQMMATGVDSLPATADRKAILVHPGWTEYHALPVVDAGGRFVGALRYETLRRLEGQARTELPSASLAASLGELYWVGLSGIIRGLGHAAATGGWQAEEEAGDAG